MRSNGVQCRLETLRENATEQTARRQNAAHVRHVYQRQLGGKRQQKHGRADELCDGSFKYLAAEPAHGHDKHADWKQKSAEAAELEEEIGHVRADWADPISGGA